MFFLKSIIVLVCLNFVININPDYDEYQFKVECNECISSFQNNTIIGNPFSPGLLKLSIIVNISSVDGYQASGFISAFITPEYRSSDVGYVINVLSNNTEFFNKNKSMSCSGDVPYSYGCVSGTYCSTNSYSCEKNGYAENPYPFTKTCTYDYSVLNVDQVLELNQTSQININCNKNNILQKEISQTYLPTSGIQLYNHTVDLIRNSEYFRASYLIDTLNYPHFYLDFYTRLNYNNKIAYEVYIKTDYAIKYDSVETASGLKFL